MQGSSLSALGDAELVAAVAGGSRDALREVYDRHAAAAYGLARRITGDEGHAQDVVQEVFTRLWVEPGRYDPERGALRSFLYRETHSRAIERVRAEEARRGRENRAHAHRPPEAAPDVDAEVWAQVRSEVVREALATLSDAERRAIELAYFGGLTYREVAVSLDAAEGTVKSRIRSGLRKLGDVLAGTGVEGGHG